MIRTASVAVTTTGSAGTATGSNTVGLIGAILSVYMDFDASAAATQDTTLAYTTRGGNILVLTNVNTDGMYHPRAKAVDNAAAAITNSHAPFYADGEQTLTLSVAQGDALTDCVTAYITYDDGT